ncbi:MAG: UDP-N-acetylmuramoyl-L-alanyl-D-glutamate--2,6-diaminopimelate ligase [Cardiobacteriaceae bacterium]|nr:UDP-N-acetylmuramoyl-L-alanyl-D-glutamate--2,6-diaminopimelate ligase [Cardiobacteriaceae bacterium]
MRLNDLLQGIAECDDTTEIHAIASDSREVRAGTLWLATRGISHHALDFYRDDMRAAAIVYEPPYANAPLRAIACEALSEKMGEIAARFYRHPSRELRVIGVTGTDGKSSLVHFLAQALDAAMLGTIGYGRLARLQEASHTTPDVLRVQRYLREFADQGIGTVAMEVSSHALAQGRVDAVDFDVAVFSNLSRDHLDYHKDEEDYFLAKARLFARPLRVAVINIDDAHGKRLLDENRIHEGAHIIAVSSSGARHGKAHAHLLAQDWQLGEGGIAMRLVYEQSGKREQAQVQSALLARFNVDNLLNVAACLLSQNIPFAAIPAKLAALAGVPGRVERLALPNGAAAIIDYAHTPKALESVLSGIRPHVPGRLWVVCGCGGDRDRGKRPLMAQAAVAFADEAVFTDDNPRTEAPLSIIHDMLAGLQNPDAAQVVQPREAAIRHVLRELQAGDAVVIAGKGHENYQIIGTVKHHYADQEVVRAWLG